jgi:hypothetical protein
LNCKQGLGNGSKKEIRKNQPSVVGHGCNPNTREAEAEGLKVLGQHGLYSEILSQENKQKSKTNDKLQQQQKN